MIDEIQIPVQLLNSCVILDRSPNHSTWVSSPIRREQMTSFKELCEDRRAKWSGMNRSRNCRWKNLILKFILNYDMLLLGLTPSAALLCMYAFIYFWVLERGPYTGKFFQGLRAHLLEELLVLWAHEPNMLTRQVVGPNYKQTNYKEINVLSGVQLFNVQISFGWKQ